MQVHNDHALNAWGILFFTVCIFALTRIQFEAEDMRVYWLLYFWFMNIVFPCAYNLKKRLLALFTGRICLDNYYIFFFSIKHFRDLAQTLNMFAVC